MKEYIVKFWYNCYDVHTHKLWGELNGDDLLILRDQKICGVNVLDVIKGYDNTQRITFEPYEPSINNSNKEPISNK